MATGCVVDKLKYQNILCSSSRNLFLVLTPAEISYSYQKIKANNCDLCNYITEFKIQNAQGGIINTLVQSKMQNMQGGLGYMLISYK